MQEPVETPPTSPSLGSLLSNSPILIAFLMVLVAAISGAYYLGSHHRDIVENAITTGVTPAPPVVQREVKEQAKENAPNIQLPAAIPSAIGSETIADVAARVSPSVVNIDVFGEVVNPSAGASETDFYFNGTRIAPFKSLPLIPQTVKNGTGSGLIIRQDGYILTNNHVVKSTNRIRVTLSDHRSFPGEIVGRDALSDLALIKIRAANLPVAKLGTSKNLRPGQWAIAIGSPLGLDQTVTVGIISAIGRTVADVAAEVAFIQTDAAINPGNSGGPLLNLAGDVIGINTFIRTDAQNIGFATPIDTAKAVATQLIAAGKINRAWVGMKMTALTDELKRKLALPASTYGSLVVSTIENSPASKAGLMPGDVVQEINGEKTPTVRDVQRLVRMHQANETLVLSVLRNGAVIRTNVTLTPMPEDID
jgi:S1-C subfamily serine protease